MSKKQNKTDAANDTTAAPADGSTPVPAKHPGRQPMTEAQKNTRKVDKALKELASNPDFTNPDRWASLSPEVLMGVEKAVIHVRTVIHAAERDALRQRLAALEGSVAPQA